MTNREACRDISHYIANGCYNGSNALSLDSLSAAITALNKQITKKPKDVRFINSDHLIGICSECGKFIDNIQNYCSKCGQMIDWEVEK